MKVSEEVLRFGESKIPYKLRESNRAKNLNIKISPGVGLEVIIPVNFPHKKIDPLLKSKGKWIVQKLAQLSPLKQSTPCTKDRETLSLLGKAYRLVTVYQQGSPSVEALGDKIIIMLPREHQDKKLKILEIWLRHQAREIISKRLEEARVKLNINYNQVFIKDQKTRWGSCSSQGNLNFNYRLVMAPLPVIDYVVVHELAHLIEMNHSKKFWSLVEQICPDYKIYRQWLREHGSKLRI